MADRAGDEAGFSSLGHSTIAAPAGAVLASVADSESIAVARVEDPTDDLDRWRHYATYLEDRQPDLDERMGVGRPTDT